jgi:ribosomal-protein-alanine N-acetyltransferase
MNLQSLNPILKHSERVALRHPRAADADEFIRLNQISADHYHPWVIAPTTHEEFQAYIERSRRDDTECLLVCHTATHAILGAINLSQIFYGNFCSAYMGYYLGEPFLRQGYMTEAIGLALDYAFNNLALHRIEANIQPDNHASIALVRSLGFTREGYSRRYLKIGDDWKDHERWAILAEDWAR